MAHLKLFPGLLVHGRPHSSDPNKDPYRIFSWFSIPCSVAGFRAFERANRWLRGDALRAAIEGTDCKIAVVGAAFWEPFISRDDFDVISYDYLDSIDILLRNPYLPRSSLKLQHERLITKSDFVFAASDALKEEVQAIATDIPVCTVTNGVDFSFFERNRYDPRVGTDLRGGEAVIGYVGSPEWVDFDLVFRAAAALPEATFVIIGATSADAAIGKNPPLISFFSAEKIIPLSQLTLMLSTLLLFRSRREKL